MPRRQTTFITGHFYHIFNKSIGYEPLFVSTQNTNRVFDLIDYYRFHTDLSYSHIMQLPEDIRINRLLQVQLTNPMVEIHAFALMPNHYHLLVKQRTEGGINSFIRNVQNSFAKYYNMKNKRAGPVFTGRFKGVMIEDEQTFLHVARYIHLNPVTSSIIPLDKLETYPFTSLPSYLERSNTSFLTKYLLDDYFVARTAHWKFICDQADYQKHLRDLKHLVHE